MEANEAKFPNECRIAMKWKVKEDVLRNIQDGALESKTFKADIPGVKYYLKLHPNGSKESDRNNVRVCLHLSFKMTKSINANFTINIKSASKKEDIKNQLYEKSMAWGKKICTRDELFNVEKKYFVNGIMEIELEGTLESRGIKRKAAKRLSLGPLLWESEDDKDVTLVVKGNEIKVHKFVLCAPSSVFKAELNSGLKEDIEKKITITEFLFETVQIAVEYFYERNIKSPLKNILRKKSDHETGESKV